MCLRKRSCLTCLLVAALSACTVQHKLHVLKSGQFGAEITPSEPMELPTVSDDVFIPQDTLVIEDIDGREVLVMKADVTEDGEVIASDRLQAAYVTARFKNVAERGGKVDLRFQIMVPREMMDQQWQLRFYPSMHMLEDTIALDPLLITGKAYRKRQLRGYEQYQRFLNSIISDSTLFIRAHQLEVFLQRNLPDIYRYRQDTSFVTDEEFASHYGVTERQAVHHYTNWVMVRRNDYRIARKDKMFRKYVKVPILSEGLKLDTVMTDEAGNFIYEYLQAVHTRPQLRKVDIILSGSIFEEDVPIYQIPSSEPLSFYISSLSSLADGSAKYLKKILTRKVEAHTACYLDFGSGRSELDLALGDNRLEVQRIRQTLAQVLDNQAFDLDSIIVSASCSPEGSWRFNQSLSRQRSAAVSHYFRSYIEQYRDSTRIYSIDLSGESFAEAEMPEIRFVSRETAENWEMLDRLVAADTNLQPAFKQRYAELGSITDPDLRERRLQACPEYPYLREKLYPKLRTVRFDFHLHRKGMVRDTLITTELDSVYMRGVQALSDRDYEKAVDILKAYNDYNTAVVYCAMDYNLTALSLLEKLEATDKVNYLKAILYSRQGEISRAVEAYLRACEQNPAFIPRGNLDPEIAALIRTYGLHAHQDDSF